MQVINWILSLMVAVCGVVMSAAAIGDVFDLFAEGIPIHDSIKYRSTEILIAFCTTMLGAHLVCHLAGVYR